MFNFEKLFFSENRFRSNTFPFFKDEINSFCDLNILLLKLLSRIELLLLLYKTFGMLILKEILLRNGGEKLNQ